MKNVTTAILVITLCLLSCDSFAGTSTSIISQSSWTPALGTIASPAPVLVPYGTAQVWTGGGYGTLIYAPLDVPNGCTVVDVTVELNVGFSLQSMQVFVQLPSSYSAVASWTSSYSGPALQIATIPVNHTVTGQAPPLYIGFSSTEQIFEGASYRYSCP